MQIFFNHVQEEHFNALIPAAKIKIPIVKLH